MTPVLPAHYVCDPVTLHALADLSRFTCEFGRVWSVSRGWEGPALSRGGFLGVS